MPRQWRDTTKDENRAGPPGDHGFYFRINHNHITGFVKGGMGRFFLDLSLVLPLYSYESAMPRLLGRGTTKDENRHRRLHSLFSF
jgi:hypothetical protein